jgi:SAM-dependent methyltransferase
VVIAKNFMCMWHAELDELLTNGATVADIGCGMGVALEMLANAYPKSTFHGFDISKHALAHAHQRLQHLPNVDLRNPEISREGMKEKTYDLLLTMDAIHDMSRPDKVLSIARKSLKDCAAGYIIADFRSEGTLVENIKAMRDMSIIGYGFSIALCMSSGLSEEGGLGLGTLGWHPARAEEMLKAAGFAAVDRLDWKHDVQNFYFAKI